jgi:hypothetical protein
LVFVLVEFPPLAFEVPPVLVDVKIGDSELVLEFELELLLLEFAFEELLLDEPLEEEFWFDVFCVEFTDVFCDWFWDCDVGGAAGVAGGAVGTLHSYSCPFTPSLPVPIKS